MGNIVKRWKNIDGTTKMVTLMIVALSVTLQIQASFFAKGDYLGIRLGISDLLLPVLGAVIGLSIITGRSRFPRFYYENKIILAIFLMCAALTISLFYGYFVLQHWASWALINKYIGFYMLIAYFLLAAWIGANQNTEYAFPLFAKAFVCFFMFICCLSLISVMLNNYSDYSVLSLHGFPWDGFMGNRNAFMLMACFSIIVLEVYRKDGEIFVFRGFAETFWLIMPFFALYNASRSGWIILGILLLYFLATNFKHTIKNIFPWMALGFFLIYISFGSVVTGEASRLRAAEQLKEVVTTPIGEELNYMGDQKRYIAIEDALEMYQQSGNFIFGAGLGVYKYFQIEKRGEFIDVIDFSTLWLLSEMGVFGLTVFSLFFLICLYHTFNFAYKQKSRIHESVFLFLIIMIVTSVLHELLYTRLLWFILGFAMVMPAFNNADLNKAEKRITDEKDIPHNIKA